MFIKAGHLIKAPFCTPVVVTLLYFLDIIDLIYPFDNRSFFLGMQEYHLFVPRVVIAIDKNTIVWRKLYPLHIGIDWNYRINGGIALRVEGIVRDSVWLYIVGM